VSFLLGLWIGVPVGMIIMACLSFARDEA